MYGNRQIAFVRDNQVKMSKVFYEIFILRLFTICLAYFLFIAFLIINGQYHAYYLSQSIAIVAAAFDISWFFMGIENFKVTVLRNFIVKLLAPVSYTHLQTKEKILDDFERRFSKDMKNYEQEQQKSLEKQANRDVQSEKKPTKDHDRGMSL